MLIYNFTGDDLVFKDNFKSVKQLSSQFMPTTYTFKVCPGKKKHK